jgi:two-component system, NarL family, nitrate/nitrite response regulator NarL
MSGDPRPGTVIVVAQDPTRAARTETALRELKGWRVDVATPRRLEALLAEHPEAIVTLVLDEAASRRMLRTMGRWPRSPAIIVVSDDPARLWTSATRALGLRAALPLDATAEELVAAVHAVHSGLLALHPEALAPSRAGDTALAAETPLTPREREIVEMMAEGASNRTIALRLAISRHTVKFHVASILVKLGARSRTEAVAVALRRGLLAV